MGGRLRAVALGLALAACSAREPGTFDYGQRSTGVIEIHFLPASRFQTVEFTLFANGSAVIREISRGPDRQVLAEVRAQLGAAKIRAMVADAVRSGLAEFDAEAFRRDAGPAYTVDGWSVTFRIDLDQLVLADGSPARPYTHGFSLSSPKEYLRRSQRPELAALERICTVLSELHRAHERELRRQRNRPRPG